MKGKYTFAYEHELIALVTIAELCGFSVHDRGTHVLLSREVGKRADLDTFYKVFHGLNWLPKGSVHIINGHIYTACENTQWERE